MSLHLQYTLPVLENPFSQRVNAIVAKTREMRRNPYWQHLYVVKADAEPALRNWALSLLIEDRVDKTASYSQFLALIKDKVGVRQTRVRKWSVTDVSLANLPGERVLVVPLFARIMRQRLFSASARSSSTTHPCSPSPCLHQRPCRFGRCTMIR